MSSIKIEMGKSLEMKRKIFIGEYFCISIMTMINNYLLQNF